MPNTKISALTAGNPAQGTDEIPIARGAANFKVTAASIAALSPAGTVTSVTGTSPVVSSGGATPDISMPAATTSVNGYLTSTDWTTFNNKGSGTVTSVGGTGTVNGITLTGTVTSSGSITLGGALSGVSLTTQVSGTLPTANGGTNLTSFTSGGAVYATSTSALTTGTLPATAGGTGNASYAVGDLVYASTTTALSRLADVATGNALISGGVGVAPSYGKIGLATHVSGTLPIANGGTGQTTASAAFNALSPVTTTGDLILGNGTNSSTRLAIGTNGYVLTSNGTTASWQAGGGGGGGVTSFSGSTTGLTPATATTGAITLGGTLSTANGGTGTSSTPSNGQLLIGNGSGYNVANLTAGSGVTITNGSGSITIAAAAAGGPTIRLMNLSTTSGSFSNQTPSSTSSKPLIGYSPPSPNAYGAFFFKTFGGLYSVASASINSMTITPSTGSPTVYSSGTDFNSFPNSFYIYDDVLACYGLQITNAALRTLFSDSSTAITSPSLKPLDASSGFSSTNPGITVSTSSGTYNNQSGLRGAVVSKVGSTYYLEFGSNNPTFDNSFSISSISFNINMSPSTYMNFSDFNVVYRENTSSGKFRVEMTVSNATLTTLLNNSFLP